MPPEQVAAINICQQGPDVSDTGMMIEPYDAAWWRQLIQHWSGLSWSGQFVVGDCTDAPDEGWLHVRETRPDMGEPRGAYALTERDQSSGSEVRWLHSVIILWPWEYYGQPNQRLGTQEGMEQVLAHELGHVMGFSHVPLETGWVMRPAAEQRFMLAEEEREMAQLAYRVGSGVAWPGVVLAPVPGRPDEDPSDRAALMALYDATNGNNWADSTNWGTDEAFYHWHGVTTSHGGRVVRLNLNSNNLTGPVPPELGALSNLVELNLESNNLTGPIPPALGDLSNLAKLNLNSNNLTGPIPSALGDLSRLGFLQLASNNLTGPIPPELGALSNLVELNLESNNLTGPIPPALGDLTNLTYLLVSANNLTGPLPLSLTNLRNLEYLRIENNAGLCAPADAAFQEWLATVRDFSGEICADEPTPTLSAASAPAEGGNPVTVTATLDNPAPANGLTVTLTTSGTATLDTDYTLSSTTITLAEGETAGTATITVTDDAEDDAGETIVIDAESTNPALTTEQLTLTIEDNDGLAPTMLTLSAAPAPIEGGNPVTVTATLDNPAPANGLTVTLTTSGTATLDTDYTLSSTTITLAEGETAGTVTITVTDDAEDDAGETIVIDAESTNPALTAEQLTLTIEDNDVTPVPALPRGGAMLLGLLLTLLGAVRVRMQDRTDIAHSY